MNCDGRLAIAIAVVVILLFGGVPSPCAAQGVTVGMATKVVSPAEVDRQPATVGTLAHMNDELRTGGEARLQISFRDSTQLNLGENATVVIDRFIYNPDEGTGEALIKTGVGAFRLATGRLSQLKDKKIVVSTPYATLGVRGTDFWWGPIDGRFGVLLLSESRLEVRNDAGAVLINKAGYGTHIDPLLKGGYSAPTPPEKWGPGMVERALSQTNVGLFPPINPGILAPGVIPLMVIPQLESDPPSSVPRSP